MLRVDRSIQALRAPTDLSLGGQGRAEEISGTGGASAQPNTLTVLTPGSSQLAPRLQFPSLLLFLYWGIEWYTSVAATANKNPKVSLSL